MGMKPENTFIKSIDRHIPQVYSEKMANPWRSGTADKWYSGVRGDLWIEYKWLSSIPPIVVPTLSALQRKWLSDRLDEGREVCVVVGCASGGAIYQNRAWEMSIPRDAFLSKVIPRSGVSNWILSITGAAPCKLNALPTQQAMSSKRRTKV